MSNINATCPNCKKLATQKLGSIANSYGWRWECDNCTWYGEWHILPSDISTYDFNYFVPYVANKDNLPE